MSNSNPPNETRSLEFTEGTSNKFWTLELRGNVHHVHFGRKGTAGQTQTKKFGSNEAARKAFDKLVSEKLAKGYRELQPQAPEPQNAATLDAPEAPREPEAVRRLREKVTPENANAAFDLGKALDAVGQGNAPEEAVLWYVHAALLDNAAAFYQLAGDCRLFGLKDLSRIYLDEALGAGHPDTKNHVGIWRIEDFGFE